MASVQRRPNGKWRARYRDDGGQEHARHFTRKVDAQSWLDEQTAQLITGTWADPRRGALTFSQWWADWLSRQVWAVGTVEAAQLAADSVPFGTVRLRDLRPSHLEAWVKAMSGPTAERGRALAPSTIRTRFNYVHMSLTAAVRDRVIGRDPCEGVSLPRPRRASAAMVLPSADDVGAALEAAPDYFRPFVAVCAFAGLRLGEAAGLRLDDVDFLRRTLTLRRQVQGTTTATTQVVPPKYGSERQVFVPEGLTAVLARHVETIGTRGEAGWLLWNPNGDGDGLWNRASAGSAWRVTRKRAGLSSEVTLHDLRHWYASGLIAAGCDVVTVQRALGHSSASITLNIYAHLWPSAEDKTRAAAAGLMAAVAAPADPVRTRGVPEGATGR